MTKWEYKVVEIFAIADHAEKAGHKFRHPEHDYHFDNIGIALGLSEVGNEGWELITISGSYYYFKRPLP